MQTITSMQNADFNLIVPIERATAGKSTLSIPALQLGYFNQQCHAHGSVAAYFSWMSNHYLGCIPELLSRLNATRDPNWNTTYQKKNLDLQKRNFIPAGTDWEHFRHAAAACGVSICFLFVFLMLAEAAGFFEKLTQINPMRRNSSLNRHKNQRKFKKFSILCRKIDVERYELHRKLKFK